MFFDLGVYGVPLPCKLKQRYDPVTPMRAMEQFIRDVGGYSFLYADTFMDEEELWQMFDRTLCAFLPFVVSVGLRGIPARPPAAVMPRAACALAATRCHWLRNPYVFDA
eukprot:COSAG01_NODE_3466_length_6056_cov_2.539198_3_plen_109_part_00